jgi:hypothetical protein
VAALLPLPSSNSQKAIRRFSQALSFILAAETSFIEEQSHTKQTGDK